MSDKLCGSCDGKDYSSSTHFHLSISFIPLSLKLNVSLPSKHDYMVYAKPTPLAYQRRENMSRRV